MVKSPPAISVECVKKLIEKGNAGAHFALAGFLKRTTLCEVGYVD